MRYASSTDLQADIDVGVKRSTDGGKTWSALQLAMDMGIYGYEADVEAKTMKVKQANKLNGIGDPCLVTDEVTGDIFCFGLWAHGHEGQASLNYSTTSYEVDDTPQFVVVKSSDDGQTWSEPVNITRQVKRPDWRACFQGPGRGITMKDGTIVIPFQFQKGPGKGASLNSTVVYSTDHGQTWHCHNSAHTVTSECAVAEIEPGVLLLTMRDETNSHYRRNFITKDLGRTWTAHETNGKWLEPTCEASLLHVDAKDNVLNRDILLFSNPNSNGRDHITIKASLDQGKTFCGEQLLDSGGSWGYTCLTMVDRETVGILYESSKGHMMFQAIPLTDLIQ